MESNTEAMQSAVRLPTPDSDTPSEPITAKRKRPSSSRSPSPPRRRTMLRDIDASRARERERQLEERLLQQKDEGVTAPLTAEEKQASAKAEYDRLLNMRSGGTYIPPARLRALQAQITDKTSKEFQRMAWEALKKSINGLINKVNVSNIKHIVPELFGENLVRGRGLFCRSIMKAQAASLPFTPIYAAMVAIVNTKLPQVGELLVKRLIVQFRKAFKRNDKAVCLSSTTFIAQLCNQQVVHEMLAAQILLILLQNPTDDSVEIAVGLTREVGQHMDEMNGQIAMLVFDQFRSILHEADIDKRIQYMIEVLFQVRKDKYKDNPAVKEELDLVEEEDQITHQAMDLDGPIDVEDGLNIFKYDSEYEEHEEAYKKLKAEILGEASDSEGDEDEDDSSSDEEETREEKEMEIKDQSNTDLTNLRRTIYLTINSSADFEECVHKLMKVNIPMGKESELPSMIIETCSQRPTYEKFYGSVGDRLARLNRLWLSEFEGQFAKYYDTIHRYETNRLRNIARFFGHIMGTGAIGWHVLSVVHLNEEETTSSSRIFIKILFQDLSEAMGMKTLQERLQDETLQQSFAGIFPTDNPRDTRFSINYFTSIGMGSITEGMREYLKNMPKPALPALPAAKHNDLSDSASMSSYSSYSSYSGSSRSYSSSPDRRPSKRTTARHRSLSASRSRTPPPRRRDSPVERPAHDRMKTSGLRGRRHQRTPSPSDSNPISRSISRSRSLSRTPPRRMRGRYDSKPVSQSPSVTPPRRSRRRDSPSVSPPPRRRHDEEHVPSGKLTREPATNHSASPQPENHRSQAPRQRSLSPYSQRVALTRQNQSNAARDMPERKVGGGRARAGDFM